MLELSAHTRLVLVAQAKLDLAVAASVAQQVAVESPRKQRAIGRRHVRVELDHPNTLGVIRRRRRLSKATARQSEINDVIVVMSSVRE